MQELLVRESDQMKRINRASSVAMLMPHDNYTFVAKNTETKNVMEKKRLLSGNAWNIKYGKTSNAFYITYVNFARRLF